MPLTFYQQSGRHMGQETRILFQAFSPIHLRWITTVAAPDCLHALSVIK